MRVCDGSCSARLGCPPAPPPHTHTYTPPPPPTHTTTTSPHKHPTHKQPIHATQSSPASSSPADAASRPGSGGRPSPPEAEGQAWTVGGWVCAGVSGVRPTRGCAAARAAATRRRPGPEASQTAPRRARAAFAEPRAARGGARHPPPGRPWAAGSSPGGSRRRSSRRRRWRAAGPRRGRRRRSNPGCGAHGMGGVEGGGPGETAAGAGRGRGGAGAAAVASWRRPVALSARAHSRLASASSSSSTNTSSPTQNLRPSTTTLSIGAPRSFPRCRCCLLPPWPACWRCCRLAAAGLPRASGLEGAAGAGARCRSWRLFDAGCGWPDSSASSSLSSFDMALGCRGVGAGGGGRHLPQRCQTVLTASTYLDASAFSAPLVARLMGLALGAGSSHEVASHFAFCCLDATNHASNSSSITRSNRTTGAQGTRRITFQS